MKFRTLITAAVLALLPLVASAATFVIPASGTGPGANNSQWQTEVTFHNAASRPIVVSLLFHDAAGPSPSQSLTIAPRSSMSIADIVRTRFGQTSATGSIEIQVADADASRLVIQSRTFNLSEAGEFGQDIPAVNVNDAAIEGDVAVLAGPSSAAAQRFNFGLHAVTATTIRWELLRADGTVAATREASYTAGTHTQYNGGVSSFFSVDPQNNDTIYAQLLSGKAILYGSSVNNATGDPTYVTSVRTRDEIRIDFAGVDLDEDGDVDIADANRDGVLDASIDMPTSLYPNYLRLVVNGQTIERVVFTIVSSPADAALIDDNGTLQVAPTGHLKGTNGEVKIRATLGGSSAVLTLPVRFF